MLGAPRAGTPNSQEGPHQCVWSPPLQVASPSSEEPNSNALDFCIMPAMLLNFLLCPWQSTGDGAEQTEATEGVGTVFGCNARDTLAFVQLFPPRAASCGCNAILGLGCNVPR
ncbi:hypothetical protein TIFTF001_030126 [Ficus carica]|uniref:Uncharacterized protein n=1 Tax=Ficus carica TaxID=3494 RepID=A0AA88J3C0_FICCA|nr:hypothetical protein TIFTF001_030126 [Ficus carica]